MKKRHFLIPSLLAAGFRVSDVDAAPPIEEVSDSASDRPIIDTLRLEHEYYLAAHRSHRSHGSHRSHRSSSGGGISPGYTPPSRNQQSTPPSSVLPSSPSIAPQKTLPGNSGKFFEIVRQVQTALYAFGYYTGAVDGIVGPQTKAALTKFQKDYGLKITGTVTPETLDALKITAK